MKWLLSTHEVDGVIIIDILSVNSAGGRNYRNLGDFISELLENGKKKVLINLANVSYIDSTGIGDLIGCYTRSLKHSAQLKLMKVSKRLRDLLTATKIIGIFEIFSDERKAIDSFHLQDRSS